jgi:imidazolonepropionase-like amidohydrolase
MLLESFSPEKAAALVQRLEHNHTWQCPTFTSRYGVKERAMRHSEHLDYIAAPIRARWQRGADATPAPTGEQQHVAKMLDEKLLQVAGDMHRAGVRFIAGTDVGGAFLVPGFSMHDELAEMVQAGFTPLQALQAATLDAARFLGREKETGSIEKGKVADLVLLDSNPLENISNTRSIDAVVVNGRLLDRKALDSLLAEARAAANRK